MSSPIGTSSQGATEVADRIAELVRTVPGVADLHAGMFGEVGTYLSGRRVSGVRIEDGVTDIHVTVYLGVSVHDVADSIRRSVAGVVGGRVDVTVEDVVTVEEVAAEGTGPSGP